MFLNNIIVIAFTIALELPMPPKQKKDLKPATRIKIVVEDVNAVEKIIKIECWVKYLFYYFAHCGSGQANKSS